LTIEKNGSDAAFGNTLFTVQRVVALNQSKGINIMPEGPEIRRAADMLSKVLEGYVVEHASFSQAPLRHYGKRFSGTRVLEVETRGKAMLTHFDHGWTIYSHNQLYGVWMVRKRGEVPSTNRQLRLRLSTATHDALLYSASDISVWPTQSLMQHPFLARIGPDILDKHLHWKAVVKRLLEPRFVSRQLGSLYLDQAFIAGLGNYLRAEILFDAGLHPLSRPTDLSRGQLGKLARSTLLLSRRSYETGGITNPPARIRKLQSEGVTGGRLRFAVFGRQGKSCYRCCAAIIRIECNTRRLYLCPDCQST
jgi:endonuclease VIII